ncbi:MAG TPA: protein kinase [Phycisphaerae bacterium]|nr:protein kinase [Phycisphaerae bacterium]
MNASAPRACLTEAELEELAGGRLSPGREAELQKHLEGCVSCRGRWEERRGDEEMFRELRAARNEPAVAGGDSPGANLTHTRGPSDGNVPPLMLPPELAVTIEGYSITREIGRGGMGVVFEAIQQRLNRKVALKILPGSSGLRDRDAVNRFRREATAAARLHHTHIVPVYDFGQSGVAHYYAMELVEGRSMTDMIRRLANANAPDASPAELERLLCDATDIEPGEPGSSGTFDRSGSFAAPGSSAGSFSLTRTRVYYRHVARWMADAADALHYAHDQGIIHRDIKPSNLLLARDGRIMILDFGLAKSQGDHSVTMTGAIVGTLRYMSPEQAMAKRMKVDHRTDIYSLGATLYELLAFQPAFAGHDDKETLGLIITRDATAPRKISSTVPRELETICLKTLEKDPGARYQTARELAEDLRRFIDDRPILAKPLGPVGRSVKFMRRRRAATVAIFSIVLLGASIAGTASYKRRAARAEEESRLAEAKAKIEEVEKLVSVGVSHIRNNEPAQATSVLSKALLIDPADYRALMNLAIAKKNLYVVTADSPTSRREHFLDEAIELFTKASDVSPNRWEPLNLKGVVLRLRGRYPDAVDAYEQGLELAERTASELEKDGRHDEAGKLIADSFAMYVNLANVYMLQYEFQKAEECLSRGALITDSKAATLWNNIAAIQLHLRKTEALDSCERARNAEPQSLPVLLLLAKLYLTLPAKEDFDRAHDLANTVDVLAAGGPLAAEIKRIRALAELRVENYAKAIDYAKSAIELNDRSAFPYLIMAIALARTESPDEAQRARDQAIVLLRQVSDGSSAMFPKVMSEYSGAVWIDSIADLDALRAEAEKLLDMKSAASQPTSQAGG